MALLRSALLALAFCAALPVHAQRAAARPMPYHPGIDVLDYDLTLLLPERGDSISGRAVLTVRRVTPVDTLVLDLLALRVDSVLADGRAIRATRDSATIRVPLAGSRDTVRVSVRYSGRPADGLIIRTDSAGRWTAFGDNWPNRGRHWIPSVDHPSDKATVTWTVEAPSARRVVANGALLEETPLPGGARTRTRWRESRPIPLYLMVIAAAPLVYYDLGQSACGLSEFGGCVAQSAYVDPVNRDWLPGAFAEVTRMVDFFARTVAPFPYEKLAHLQSSTRFGGMENASAIFYSDRGIRTGTMGTGVVAHETAHQWFGDAVTPHEWPHLWLSEGFATYGEQQWVQHARGDSAFRAGMRRIRTQIIAAPEVAQRPVIDTAQTDLLELLNTNSYQKGGWVLHMLRVLVGDSTYARGIRRYYAAHRHGTALTGDLQAAMEAEARQPLGWFFDQWLRRPGWVVARTAWRYDRAAGRVMLTVSQDGRFPPYRFPLTVSVTGADGRTRRVRVDVPARRTAQLPLPIPVAASPRAVEVDPDVELLAELTGPAADSQE